MHRTSSFSQFQECSTVTVESVGKRMKVYGGKTFMWNGENRYKQFYICSIRSEVLVFVKFRMFDISGKWHEFEDLPK